MRILILGGTVFLGRHVAEEALARGHEVTIYTRGLHGTRARPASSTCAATAPTSRRCAAAPGTPRSTPPATTRAHVAASAALDIGHYVFVSSCNAYPDWPDKPVDEDSPVWEDGEGYGPDKAAAERVVLPDGAVVRAGLIVGPHDNVFRLPWWVRRIMRGRDGPGARAIRSGRCR